MQVPATTTYAARRNARVLVVALGTNGTAAGTDYSDDGVSLDSLSAGAYTLVTYAATASGSSGVVRSTVVRAGYTADPAFTSARLLGLPACPTAVTVNGIGASFTCDDVNLAVAVSNFNASLSAPLTLAWS